MRRRGSRWRGGRRTPPQVDSPHSSLLTLQLVGRALQPQGSARSPAPPLRSQSPVPAYRREPRSLWGSLDPPPPSPLRHFLPLPLSRSLWSLNLGARRRAPPPAPSSPMLMVCPLLPTISQLCAVAPSPLASSRGPHTSQLAPAPRGPSGRGSGRAVLEVMSLSHEAAARTCHSLNPSRGNPGTEGGVCWGFGSQVCLLPPRTNQCPPYCAPGSLSVKWVAGEALESSLKLACAPEDLFPLDKKSGLGPGS